MLSNHAGTRRDSGQVITNVKGMAEIKVCDSCGSYLANEVIIPVSPISHLWRTNGAPTIPERALIAELLLDARQTVAQIDITIEDLQARLVGLLTKRNSTMEVITYHDSLLSPIRRLLDEALSHIFLLCLPVSNEKSRISIKRAPLLLTQVCISWRTCAISSQRLWFSFKLSSRFKTHPSLMDLWLSHTLSSLLSICMTVSCRDHACPIWPSISRIIQYCDRWQELSVHMSTSVLSRFGSIQYRLRLLEKYSFNLTNDDGGIAKFKPPARGLTRKHPARRLAVSSAQLRLFSFSMCSPSAIFSCRPPMTKYERSSTTYDC